VKLTPLDIRRQEFKKVVRGVDPEEVSVFLDMVAGEYERILREAKALGEERDELKRKVDEFDSMREAIHGAVVMAKKSADDTMSQAKKEAELRLKEAEVESERMLEDTRRQASLLRRELDDIRNQRSILVDRLRSLLDSQMKMLEAYVGDWEFDERRRDEDESRHVGSRASRRGEDARSFETRTSPRSPWGEEAAASRPSHEPARPQAQEDRGRREYEERGRADGGARGPEAAEDAVAPDVVSPSVEHDHLGNRLDESLRDPGRSESSTARRWIDHFRPGRHRETRESEGAPFSGQERASAGDEGEGEPTEERGAEEPRGRGAGEREGRSAWTRIRELTPRQSK
jgi:cell division initiation protein